MTELTEWGNDQRVWGSKNLDAAGIFPLNFDRFTEGSHRQICTSFINQSNWNEMDYGEFKVFHGL